MILTYSTEETGRMALPNAAREFEQTVFLKKIETKYCTEYRVLTEDQVLDPDSDIYIDRIEYIGGGIMVNKNYGAFGYCYKSQVKDAVEKFAAIYGDDCIVYVGQFKKCYDIADIVRKDRRAPRFERYMNFKTKTIDLEYKWQSIKSLYEALGENKYLVIIRK